MNPTETILTPPTVANIKVMPGLRAMIEAGTAVYIGRKFGGFEASEWENPNPIKIDTKEARRASIDKFCRQILQNEVRHRLPKLAGLTLACWCDPEPCHGHVLAVLVGMIRWHGSLCPHCRQPLNVWLNWNPDSGMIYESWWCANYAFHYTKSPRLENAGQAARGHIAALIP